jgi:transcriptional regulator with XRE-family HTH domain
VTTQHPLDETAPATGPGAGAVGAAVREERTRRGLSTRALAAAAGVSQPFLTNVENGKVMPSIASLYSIAAALGVTASALLPEQPIRLEIVRAGAGARMLIQDDGTAGYSQLLAGARGRALEAYRFDLAPGFHEDQAYAHDGEDFVHVLSGTLIYRYDGLPDVTLADGDCLWVDGRGAHTWAVPADQEGSTIVMLVTAAGTIRPHTHVRSDS